MLADYYLEKQGLTVVECDFGFVAGKIVPVKAGPVPEGTPESKTPWLYMAELFIRQAEREKRRSVELVTGFLKWGKEQGASYAAGTILPQAGSSSTAMLAALVGGFRLWYVEGVAIWIRRELSDL